MAVVFLAGGGGMGCASRGKVASNANPSGLSAAAAAASTSLETVPADRSPAAEARPKAPQGAASPIAKYVDVHHGFEIERPDGSWAFKNGESLSTDAITVPVVVSHTDGDAQVVVQVAPAVATPLQFAERLTEGLRTRAGFQTSDIEPIPLAEGAVGFDFEVEDQMHGRVAILDGADGRVFVLLATWPRQSPRALEQQVNQILGSMRAAP